MIRRSSTLLRVSSVARIAALTPIAAQAQTGVDSSTGVTAGVDDTTPKVGSQTGGEIVVTGSRIRRPELQGLEPTTSIGQQYLDNRNLTNIADALNELPQFRGSVTPDDVQSGYGSGVNFINAYGLGSNRTLTQVDGKRVVSSNVPSLFGPGSPGTQVDLNIIPSILIDRIAFGYHRRCAGLWLGRNCGYGQHHPAQQLSGSCWCRAITNQLAWR